MYCCLIEMQYIVRHAKETGKEDWEHILSIPERYNFKGIFRSVECKMDTGYFLVFGLSIVLNYLIWFSIAKDN